MTITKYDDLIDLRDVIARVEELREEIERVSGDEEHDIKGDAEWLADARTELVELESFLEECRGNGGDEQWEGEWYPVTAIRESHFKDYAMELAEDIGAINADAGWPNNCIDWDQAARELRMDYTAVDFDGITYWVR